jgi:hypothetical protein
MLHVCAREWACTEHAARNTPAVAFRTQQQRTHARTHTSTREETKGHTHTHTHTHTRTHTHIRKFATLLTSKCCAAMLEANMCWREAQEKLTAWFLRTFACPDCSSACAQEKSRRASLLTLIQILKMGFMFGDSGQPARVWEGKGLRVKALLDFLRESGVGCVGPNTCPETPDTARTTLQKSGDLLSLPHTDLELCEEHGEVVSCRYHIAQQVLISNCVALFFLSQASSRYRSSHAGLSVHSSVAEFCFCSAFPFFSAQGYPGRKCAGLIIFVFEYT